MLGRIAWLVAILVAASMALARAEVADLPARVEVHAIPTSWISDEQFLKGEDKGRRVTVAGELRIA
jgi:hypothetical protein